MKRLFLLTLIGLLGTVPVGPSRAQQPAGSAAPGALGAPSAQQAAQALAVLKDDARRNEMIGVLETIARGTPATTASAATTSPAPVGQTPTSQPPAGPAATGQVAAGGPQEHPVAPAAAAPKLGLPLAPDSLGAQVLVGVSDRLETLSADVGDTVRALTNFTLLERWAKGLIADPDGRAEVLDAGWKLAIVALIALGIEAVAGRLIRRPRRALLRMAPIPAPPNPASPTSHPTSTNATAPALAAVPLTQVPPPSVATMAPSAAAAQGAREARQRRRERLAATLRRVPLVLARLLLDLVPVLLLAAASYGLLGSRLGEPATTKLVILALLNAYLAVRVVTVTSRAILSPDGPGLRLVPMGDAVAWTTLRWIGRVAVVALFGYAVAEAGLLFGLYRVAHDALVKMVALVVHLMLVVFVLQSRGPVARLIHAPPGATGVVAVLRNRVAQVWHIVVVFYIVALWVVWALDVPGGFRKLLVVFVSTVVVAGVARMLAMAVVNWLDHLVIADPARAARAPGMDSALRRYQPAMRGLVHGVVGVSGLILLMQIWGLDSLSWFRGDALGGRLVSAVLTSAVTVALALLIWEASNAAVQNHLARLAREGHPARSARLRTLLPMLRTTLLVAITLFAGLTVLSQIGVNIAPLLAGAGVIGLAIGFGSQKLVQDIITGLFLLLENTMQVGDVVTLGGLTGTVENLSIRTIRLRALDGAVHIVPFSAVTTVTNMTRDFAYALLDVSVGLNEEPDRIAEVIQGVADTMRAESRWGAAITDRMEIMGVEKFVDTAWVLRCRLRTVPSQRWNVARELNRRLKYRFDEARIESPFTSYRALSAALPDPPNAKEAAE